MGWTVQGLNPGKGKIFCTCPGWSWGLPSFLYNGCQVSFLGVKWPEHGTDHPPPIQHQGQRKSTAISQLPLWPSWPVLGSILFFITTSKPINCTSYSSSSDYYYYYYYYHHHHYHCYYYHYFNYHNHRHHRRQYSMTAQFQVLASSTYLPQPC